MKSISLVRVLSEFPIAVVMPNWLLDAASAAGLFRVKSEFSKSLLSLGLVVSSVIASSDQSVDLLTDGITSVSIVLGLLVRFVEAGEISAAELAVSVSMVFCFLFFWFSPGAVGSDSLDLSAGLVGSVKVIFDGTTLHLLGNKNDILKFFIFPS